MKWLGRTWHRYGRIVPLNEQCNVCRRSTNTRKRFQCLIRFLLIKFAKFLQCKPWDLVTKCPERFSIWPSSNDNFFRVTGPLWGESTGHPHKGQWRGALIFSFIYAWTNGWANNGDAGDLKRHRAHFNVTLMYWTSIKSKSRGFVILIVFKPWSPLAWISYHNRYKVWDEMTYPFPNTYRVLGADPVRRMSLDAAPCIIL